PPLLLTTPTPQAPLYPYLNPSNSSTSASNPLICTFTTTTTPNAKAGRTLNFTPPPPVPSNPATSITPAKQALSGTNQRLSGPSSSGDISSALPFPFLFLLFFPAAPPAHSSKTPHPEWEGAARVREGGEVGEGEEEGEGGEEAGVEGVCGGVAGAEGVDEVRLFCGGG
ncbi:hypothetical protein V500_10077, partial [Pseudogymnoascus sp. VKM F-4518 (FW-2643)]